MLITTQDQNKKRIELLATLREQALKNKEELLKVMGKTLIINNPSLEAVLISLQTLELRVPLAIEVIKELRQEP